MNTVTITPDVKLSVAKIMGQMTFIDRALELHHWPDGKPTADQLYDMEVMHQFGDLAAVTLELIDFGDAIRASFQFRFENIDSTPVVDAGGIELPLLDRSQIKTTRLIYHGKGNHLEYAHLLRDTYRPNPPKLPDHTRAAFESGHARHISGGRQSAKFSIASADARKITIINTGEKGFCFARDDQGMIIFIHRRDVEGNWNPQVGDRGIAGGVVMTPKGLSGRAVRPLSPEVQS